MRPLRLNALPETVRHREKSSRYAPRSRISPPTVNCAFIKGGPTVADMTPARVRYVFESGPWYRLRFATGSPTTYPSEGGEIVLADVNLVVLAKLINGTTLPPEGELAKLSFQCDSCCFPVDHGMREV